MIEASRLRFLNDQPERTGHYVLYWMQQSVRASFNPALETAVHHANRLNLPLVVCFGLTDGYPDANARHYAFLLQGLRDVESALHKRGIAFVMQRGSPDAVAIHFAKEAALLVCDRGYLRIQTQWRDSVAKAVSCQVLQVEGDVVVPIDLASSKRETAARTLRPKIMRLRDDFLVPLEPTALVHKATKLKLPRSTDLSDPLALTAALDVDHSITPVSRLHGGHSEARRHLDAFLNDTLDHYDEGRSDPAQDAVSMMSPYLHFGHISPIEIAVAVAATPADRPSRASYLEELIIRRELSMNFVAREPHYDSYQCLPEWARTSLARHQKDARPHRYNKKELIAAETHDPWWNASMREMRDTGFMHNYMRMYWGKKILEWSPTPEEGYATTLALNNTYFLDGRDANSFANVAWIYGLHDRPWPERPIFGTVRSMMASGLQRKFDMSGYVRRVADLSEAEAG